MHLHVYLCFYLCYSGLDWVKTCVWWRRNKYMCIALSNSQYLFVFRLFVLENLYCSEHAVVGGSYIIMRCFLMCYLALMGTTSHHGWIKYLNPWLMISFFAFELFFSLVVISTSFDTCFLSCDLVINKIITCPKQVLLIHKQFAVVLCTFIVMIKF